MSGSGNSRQCLITQLSLPLQSKSSFTGMSHALCSCIYQLPAAAAAATTPSEH